MECRISHYIKDFMKKNMTEKCLSIERNKKLFSVEEKLLQDTKSFYNTIQSQTTSISLQVCLPKCFAEFYKPKKKVLFSTEKLWHKNSRT